LPPSENDTVLTIDAYLDGRPCDNCEKEGAVFRVRCEAGTFEADLCAKCLGRQCRLRMKGRAAAAGDPPANATS
jgi:hypothetical protein